MIIMIVINSIVISILLGILLGFNYRKNIVEEEICNTKEQANQIILDSLKNAETNKKELIFEAKEEIYKIRKELDAESKEHRLEIIKNEKRLQIKEEQLNKKIEQLEKKNEYINTKIINTQKITQEIEIIKNEQLITLQKISGLTKKEAISILISKVKNDIKHETALLLKELNRNVKENAENYARNIISLAIQKCSIDHISDNTISIVNLPNDEMKGRIIGREGRNIRTIEMLTGVDLIIDDTPETIILSSFDPLRRETAKIVIETLISDGMIHPSKIEEVVKRSKKEINKLIIQEGENAVLMLGLHNIHPDIIKILGKMKYRTSYGQNILNHSIEVAIISGIIASELGLNTMDFKRAGLLHDLGKAVHYNEQNSSHVQIGVEILKKYKESENIIHAVEAHHGDIEPNSIEACVIQAADTISAARPGARRENLETYIKRLKSLELITNNVPGVEKSFVIKAGREIRIIVNPNIISENDMIILSREIAKKIENELTYPGQIKINLLREVRVIEYAK